MAEEPQDEGASTSGNAIINHILTPGSTLNPNFLRIMDSAFAALLVVLLSMLAATKSYHFVALTVIELALWGTVKWFVAELRAVTSQQEVMTDQEPTKNIDNEEPKKDR